MADEAAATGVAAGAVGVAGEAELAEETACVTAGIDEAATAAGRITGVAGAAVGVPGVEASFAGVSGTGVAGVADASAGVGTPVCLFPLLSDVGIHFSVMRSQLEG